MPARQRTFDAMKQRALAAEARAEQAERELAEVSGANGRLAARVDELETEVASQTALLTEFRESHSTLCRIAGLPEQRETS